MYMEFSTVVEAKKKRVCTGVCIYVCVWFLFIYDLWYLWLNYAFFPHCCTTVWHYLDLLFHPVVHYGLNKNTGQYFWQWCVIQLK